MTIRPEELAKQQADKLEQQYVSIRYQQEDMPEPTLDCRQRTLSGPQDSAIPGSRTGIPTEIRAEEYLGDKIHCVTQWGFRLDVQSKDKSRAMPIEERRRVGQVVTRRKVSLLFPSIYPALSQRELVIQCTNSRLYGPLEEQDWQPCIMYLPPDVANLEVAIFEDQFTHVELTDIDKDGNRLSTAVLDFLPDPRRTPAPNQASPIGYTIMEEVRVVKQENPL